MRSTTPEHISLQNTTFPEKVANPVQVASEEYTGRFIMHSGITKIYYRKPLGTVFTKPVQIEGTTLKIFPSKLCFIVVHISAARRCECMQ